MTTASTTVTLPASTLSAAANVSQTTVATTTGLASLGGILAIAGPFIASLFPSTANLITGIFSTLPGLAVAAGALVHAMHLSAAATQVTDAIIASVTAASTTVTSSLGGATS